MAVRHSASNKVSSSTRPVSVPAIVGAVVVAIALIGGLGWHYFGPQGLSGPTKPISSADQANWAWVKDAAAKTNGDILKLSPDDQRKAYSIIGPRAPFEFVALGRHAKAGP